MSNPVPEKITGSKTGRTIAPSDTGTSANPTREAGTSTSEDSVPVPMEIPTIPAGNPPMSPEQPLQPPTGHQPRQPTEQQSPRQYVPPPPPPPQPLDIEPPERSTIMGMYRSLRYLDRLIKKIQEDTKKHLREALPPILKISSNGTMRFVEPAVVALYVVNTTESLKCLGCNQMTQSACGNCRHAPYCSGFCLQKDWGSHEGACKLAVAATAQGVTEALLRA